MSDEIINTYDQLMHAKKVGLPCVAVLETSMGCWDVYFPGVETDPGAHWQHYGRKCFYVMSEKGETRFERKAAALAKAQAWASKHYGPVESWSRNRMRDYLDARVHKQFPLRKITRKAV